MQFATVIALANATPVSVLCEAWGADRESVMSRRAYMVPMSLREAGDLAELHGLKLEDVLPV